MSSDCLINSRELKSYMLKMQSFTEVVSDNDTSQLQLITVKLSLPRILHNSRTSITGYANVFAYSFHL